MGTINLNILFNLLTDNQNKVSNVGSKILEYAILKEQMDKVEEQSWYFKSALESKQKQLKSINNSYELYRNEFNANSIDTLIETKNELLQKLEERKNCSGSGWIFFSIKSMIRSEIDCADEMLLLKSKVDYLYEIEFYLSNLDELSKII